MPTEEELEWINEDLRPLAYPTSKLELLPNNSNKGDVPATMASLSTFGQMEPIVCSLRPGTDIGVVLAGNTRLKAARLMGKEWIAVAWKKDGTEEHDLAYATADNSTARKGELDIETELENLRIIESDDALLAAAGYDLVSVEDLVLQIQGQEAALDVDEALSQDLSEMHLDDDSDDTVGPLPDKPKELKRVIQFTIIFDTEEQREVWQAFLRQIKQEYPVSLGFDTTAERLTHVLEMYMEE